jgi:hypothetical protein
MPSYSVEAPWYLPSVALVSMPSYSVEAPWYLPSVALVSMPSYSMKASWYFDIGTIDYIINDLEHLAFYEKYQGKKQIQTAGGSGISIRHVSHSMIHTTPRDLHICNILHAPQSHQAPTFRSLLALLMTITYFFNIIPIILLSTTRPL